ncbi:MAG: glycosyl hydrolase family 18 protein [Candidatus Nanopelagicales bacterium]
MTMRRLPAVLAAAGVLVAGSVSGVPALADGGGRAPAGTGVSAIFDEIYDDGFAANNANVPFRKFDIVYVAFGHIDPRTLKFGFEKKVGVSVERARLKQLKQKTRTLRKAGRLKLVMSLGYGPQETDAAGNPLLEKNPAKTAASIRRFLDANNLDGFDIDYEDPLFSNAAAFRDVTRELRGALGRRLLLTITPNTTESLVGGVLNRKYDWVNAQSYNASGDAPFDVTDLLDLGVKPRKVVAGGDVTNRNNYREDRNRVAWAIDQFRRYGLGGVFLWQMQPMTQRLPEDGPTMRQYVRQVYTATHGPTDGRG